MFRVVSQKYDLLSTSWEDVIVPGPPGCGNFYIPYTNESLRVLNVNSWKTETKVGTIQCPYID